MSIMKKLKALRSFGNGGITSSINLEDKRVLHPIKGEPLSDKKRKGVKGVDSNIVKTLIEKSLDYNQEPNTVLAMALQETNLGQGYSHSFNPLMYNSKNREENDSLLMGSEN